MITYCGHLARAARSQSDQGAALPVQRMRRTLRYAIIGQIASSCVAD